jgi:hypothetical protein
MKDTIKRYAVSSLITFVGMFLLVFSAELMQPSFIFSQASITSLVVSSLIVATRGVAKVVWEFSAYLLRSNESV